MLTSNLTQHCHAFWSLASAQDQPRLVAAALSYTTGTDLAPGPHERVVLTRFVLGQLTFAQVLEQLAVV